MNAPFVAAPEALIMSAIIGLAVLLFLIIVMRFQALVAIIVSAIVIGLVAGMPFSMITATIEKGIGSTLQGIALLVGLGSMFGAILEVSGGAEVIAQTLVRKFGEDKSTWALGLTGIIVATPVFFDAGFIILVPLAFSIARKTGKSVLLYAIPLVAGLAVGHAFIPPTPGPILVANLIGVDLGYVIGFGILVGIPAMIVAGPLYGKFISERIYVPVPEAYSNPPQIDESKLPSFALVLGLITIPLGLILLNTVSGIVPAMQPFKPVLSFIGYPFVALTIATVAAMFMLGTRYGYTRLELEKVMTKSLEPTGLILLVTAGGGVIRWMFQDSGLGLVIGKFFATSSIPLVVVAFVIALAVRISVGSATVAMTMAGGLIAAMPEVAALSPVAKTALVIAIASGSTAASHFNDSGFWLFKSYLNIDEKTNLKSWTMLETLVGLTGFVGACVISFWG